MKQKDQAKEKMKKELKETLNLTRFAEDNSTGWTGDAVPV